MYNITKLVKTPSDLTTELLIVNYHIALRFSHKENGKIAVTYVWKFSLFSKSNSFFSHGFNLGLVKNDYILPFSLHIKLPCEMLT